MACPTWSGADDARKAPREMLRASVKCSLLSESDRGANAAKSIASAIDFAAFSRTISLDKSEHFTEALNISLGGFFSRRQPRSRWACPSIARCAARRSDGAGRRRTHCTARVVHVRTSHTATAGSFRRPKSRNTTRRNRRTAEDSAPWIQAPRFTERLYPKGRSGGDALKPKPQGLG